MAQSPLWWSAQLILVVLVSGALLGAPDIAVGVPAPGGQDPARARLRRTLAGHVVVAVVLVGVAALLARPPLGLLGPAWLVALGGGSLFVARRRRPEGVVAPPQAAPVGLLGGAPAQLGPFVVLAAAAAAVLALWERIPASLPRPDDGVISATPATLLSGLGIGAALCALGLLAAWGLGRAAAGRVDADAAARRSIAAGVILGGEYVVALSYGLLALVPLVAPARLGRVGPAGLLVPAVAALAATALLVQAGQALARGRPAESGGKPRDPRWRLGVFFVDPTDGRLLVGKRVGLGWTLNLGNPWSWLVIALLAVVIAFVLLVAGVK